MNKCYLPLSSSIGELVLEYDNQLDKLFLFHERVQCQIQLILGETYLLPDVLKAFKSFSDALAPLVNPPINFGERQLKEKDMGDKYDIYDKYFEVTRVREMTAGQFVQQYLDTSAEIIDELQYTSMSRGEVAYILKGWEAANEIILSGKESNPDFSLDDVNRCNVPQDMENRALYRWKLAHHGFALFMIFSGYAFDKAILMIQEDGDEDVILDWLDKGAHLFRATAACMEFGNSFTSTVYKNVVRPDMSKANEEANLPNGFSGTQNFDYVTWRKMKVKMLSTIKELKANGNLSEKVLEGVELFRSFYLEDMHVHAIIAMRMVGIEKSLLQEGFTRGNAKPVKLTAADVLRMMAKMRDKETAWIAE